MHKIVFLKTLTNCSLETELNPIIGGVREDKIVIGTWMAIEKSREILIYCIRFVDFVHHIPEIVEEEKILS